MIKTKLCALALFTGFAWAAIPAQAQPAPAVQVTEAWVRGTVPQQQGSGAFMRITSPHAARLVAVSSPLAAMTELHEMKMDDGVMRMAAIPALVLPAGQTVELKPGGYHVMLMGLKQQLKAGDQVPLTLTIESAGGKTSQVELKLPVKPLGQ